MYKWCFLKLENLIVEEYGGVRHVVCNIFAEVWVKVSHARLVDCLCAYAPSDASGVLTAA